MPAYRIRLDPHIRLMEDDLTRRPRPVARTLARLVDLLEGAHARYAVVGAVAMGAHGVRRFTEDIDILVAAQDVDAVLRAARRSLREVTRQPPAGPPLQVKLRSRRAPAGETPDIDLLVPMHAVEEWALASAVRASLAGRKVDVATVEALVVLKLRAYLDDPRSRAGLKHRSDAMTLLESAPVDLRALRRFLAGSPDLLAELEKALAAPRPRGRVR